MMKPGCVIVAILLVLPLPLFAQGGDVTAELFDHVLDGRTLDLFPFLPKLHLVRGMTVDRLMLLLSAGIVYAAFAITFRRPSLKPRGAASALESLVLLVRDEMVYPVMGEEKGDKWVPFFTTLFLFLLVMNFLGLIPAFKTATGSITVTSALALVVLVLIFVTGIRSLGLGSFFRNLYPKGTVVPLGLFVAVLEFVGIFIRSVVLSLRIFANMFAGHLAILSFLVLMIVLNPFFAVVSLPFALFTYALEVLVALIQAVVFTLLSCIFIDMAGSAHEAPAEEKKEKE